MESDLEKKRIRWELIILLLMYVGYVAYMICRNTAIVSSPELIADPELGMTKTEYGQLMAYHSAGAVVGKFLSGFAVDLFGGRMVYLVTLGLTAATTVLFGMSSRFGILAALNFTGQGAKSGGWPSIAALVRSWYSPKKYGRVWGFISTGSRVGVMVATLLLGTLLSNGVHWRTLFYVSGGIAVAIWFLLLFFLKSGPEKVGLPRPEPEDETKKGPHPLDETTVAQATMVFMRSPRVWLIGLSMAFTTILMDFLNFIPLYMVESLGLDSGQAGKATTFYPLGCFVGVLAAGVLYDKLSRKQRIWAIGGALGIGVLTIGMLWGLGKMSLSPGASIKLAFALIFLFGLVLAPAYYLPMSVFSINFGGPHCGFLICLLDMFGYVGATIFNYFGGSLAEIYGWSVFLAVLGAITFTATCLVSGFLYLDYKKDGALGDD